MIYFHRGPLSSHLPNQLNSAFKLVEKQHLQPGQLSLELGNEAEPNGRPEMTTQTVEETCIFTSENDELLHTSGAGDMRELEVVVEVPSSFV